MQCARMIHTGGRARSLAGLAVVTVLVVLVSAVGHRLEAATLILKTHPPGSELRLDGRTLGLSDAQGLLRIDGMSSGPHLLELRRDEFKARAFIFTVSEGTSARTLRLMPRRPDPSGGGENEPEEATGSVVIDTRIEGISLALNGAHLGQSDEEGRRIVEGLRTGRYLLQASWAGHVFAERSLEITPEPGADPEQPALVRLEPPQEALDALAPPSSLYMAIALALGSLLGAILVLAQRRKASARAPDDERAPGLDSAEAPPNLHVRFAPSSLEALEGRPLTPDIRLGRLLEVDPVRASYAGLIERGKIPCRVEVFQAALSDDIELAIPLLASLQQSAQITHPNLISVEAFGKTSEGVLFVACEAYEGERLSALLARQGRLPPGATLDVLRGVALALEHTHGQGLLHRDLRPEHVILQEQASRAQRVKLNGFGVARAWQRHPSPIEQDVDMLRAQAPEQLAGEPIDARADVFALGVLAFRLLTGQAPYDATDRDALLASYASGALPPMRTTRLPTLVRAAIQEALWVDRDRRTASAQALYDALAEGLE